MKGKQIDCLMALDLLKQGLLLRSMGVMPPALFSWKDERVCISSSGFSMRLREDNFLEVYASCAFAVHERGEEIDEVRDAEYYAWRANRQ